MASNISPCASTSVAISVNICAMSAMLLSSRRMSWCFSLIRCTSSNSRACAPAIFFATISAVVSPASIISARSSGEASGMRISISRACRLSRASLKSTCAFWKSARSCWCFFAIACCMLILILPSAEFGLIFSSSSDLDFNFCSSSLTPAKTPLVSSTRVWSRSDTSLCLSCVVACKASSSTSPICFTFALPLASSDWSLLTRSKNSRMKPDLPPVSFAVAGVLGNRPLDPERVNVAGVNVFLPCAIRWNSARRSRTRRSAARAMALGRWGARARARLPPPA
mmetsp:Transcript_97057/g.313388  ORF Transcript_97057/g.313388 Transcript_97057/m.313388 type:complete len:282 (+) Transcript_97057:273-1118(+)